MKTSVILLAALLMTSTGNAGVKAKIGSALSKATKKSSSRLLPDASQMRQSFEETFILTTKADIRSGEVTGEIIGRISTGESKLILRPAITVTQPNTVSMYYMPRLKIETSIKYFDRGGSELLYELRDLFSDNVLMKSKVTLARSDKGTTTLNIDFENAGVQEFRALASKLELLQARHTIPKMSK